MSKTGIITYHSAYNYGSALQALATQEAVSAFAPGAEIINYRMKSQKDVYTLYRTAFGMKTLVKDLMQLPIQKKRKLRAERFEDFFKSYFALTDACETPEDVYRLWTRFDTIVSGSDQIWNKHSLELENCGWEYMHPYLLKGFSGKKVSYASSISNMTDEELEEIKACVNEFDAVSMREISSTERMAGILDVDVTNVLDPTFLLTKEDWIRKLGLKKNTGEKFILYYSLGGVSYIKKNRPLLTKLAQQYGCKVRVIMPFVHVTGDDTIEPHPEYGPVEFLNSIYNAELVVTDSFHGTILSVNFGKELYSLCKKGGSTFRKTDILGALGIGERALFESSDMVTKHFEPINYDDVYARLHEMRWSSLAYLKSALTEG
ncbi:MAG: polysaccharide pyruvyl transferase family protein [Ruminococcus sp.]|nr:polysaccharide pyruvyl transferase family protein [Ruminococcus sp.]